MPPTEEGYANVQEVRTNTCPRREGMTALHVSPMLSPPLHGCAKCLLSTPVPPKARRRNEAAREHGRGSSVKAFQSSLRRLENKGRWWCGGVCWRCCVLVRMCLLDHLRRSCCWFSSVWLLFSSCSLPGTVLFLLFSLGCRDNVGSVVLLLRCGF